MRWRNHDEKVEILMNDRGGAPWSTGWHDPILCIARAVVLVGLRERGAEMQAAWSALDTGNLP
jgi:hypothetical protein